MQGDSHHGNLLPVQGGNSGSRISNGNSNSSSNPISDEEIMEILKSVAQLKQKRPDIYEADDFFPITQEIMGMTNDHPDAYLWDRSGAVNFWRFHEQWKAWHKEYLRNPSLGEVPSQPVFSEHYRLMRLKSKYR